MDLINILSLLVGVIGLLLAIIQQIRVTKNKKKDYRRYWDIAKTAHIVMARIENVKGQIEKHLENCPSQVLLTWGQAHEAAAQLVRISLQNVFLQDVKIDEKQVKYWQETGLLSGFLLATFNQMRLQPPKNWTSTTNDKIKEQDV
jgi:hypothetical protein